MSQNFTPIVADQRVAKIPRSRFATIASRWRIKRVELASRHVRFITRNFCPPIWPRLAVVAQTRVSASEDYQPPEGSRGWADALLVDARTRAREVGQLRRLADRRGRISRSSQGLNEHNPSTKPRGVRFPPPRCKRR